MFMMQRRRFEFTVFRVVPILALLVGIGCPLSGQALHPVAGRDFVVRYIPPPGSPLEKADSLTLVYVFDSWGKRKGTRLALLKNVRTPGPMHRWVPLRKSRGAWTATVAIPSEKYSVFSYYVTDGKYADYNRNRTYVDYIYDEDGRPVENAHLAMLPFLKMAGADDAELAEEAQKEFLAYPANFRAYYLYWKYLLRATRNAPDTRFDIIEQLQLLDAQAGENFKFLNLATRTYFYLLNDVTMAFHYRQKIPVDQMEADVAVMVDPGEMAAKKKAHEKYKERVRKAYVGKTAPDVVLKEFGGDAVRLSTLRGKVVALNFWHNNCGPCPKTTDALQKLFTRYEAEDFEVAAVYASTDTLVLEGIIRDRGYTFPVYLNSREALKAYGVDYIPQTFLLDRKGVVRYVFFGPSLGYERQLEQAIAELLGRS